ncbi:MAG: hypothetical protein A3K16_04225 [Omnitrophica bacterium RIFCSPLOWO2_01_FULL_45_24]|nr:MAG: hypothetical protein A3G36_05815 [Omnitrophica bacterium RIFCSPLOWO2_12_FULL_45_13]OGW94987.1 MAG: hypothetical protein A3K16_04225 [Omnitrophica bacterium RIFCSPLOWO2_01_FULL_45_24]
MKRIVYTSHLEFRLNVRNIPHNLPKRIFQEAKEHYYDSATGHCMAIGKYEFEGKIRDVALTYDDKRYAIEIITIHPIRPYQKHSRINSGRRKKI